MSYQVFIEKDVYKDLERIPAKDLDRILEAVNALELDPRGPGSKKLKGRGDRWRVRKGDYRIVFSIDDALKAVYVLLVRHRKDVYKDML